STLKPHVGCIPISQQFIKAARVIQRFDKFPLEAGTFVNLFRGCIFMQRRVISTETDQGCSFPFVPVCFFLSKSGFSCNLRGSIKVCQGLIDISSTSEAESNIAKIVAGGRFKPEPFADL